MAYTTVLEAVAARRAGSSPVPSTINNFSVPSADRPFCLCNERYLMDTFPSGFALVNVIVSGQVILSGYFFRLPVTK